jgi:hypothetical protein
MFEIEPKARRKRRAIQKKEFDPVSLITILYLAGMAILWLAMN